MLLDSVRTLMEPTVYAYRAKCKPFQLVQKSDIAQSGGEELVKINTYRD